MTTIPGVTTGPDGWRPCKMYNNTEVQCLRYKKIL